MPKVIPCSAYASYLASQEPVYDREILRDRTPKNSDWMGYFKTDPFKAYTGVEHTVDRFHDVWPDTTRPWETLDGVACSGRPCDPDENVIGWGWSRETYARERQSWASDLICFDEVMELTRAQEHFSQIISAILRPATTRIMDAWIQRRTAELAGNKICVTTGLPEFTFTWDAGGYIFMNTDQDPTGRLTSPVLQNFAWDQYSIGGSSVADDGFSPLHLKTDIDTLRYMEKQDADLQTAWRFQRFGMASKEFYKYGFMAQIGDYMARAIMTPLRFNKIAAGRYQQVLPYRNVAATSGLKRERNPDYKRAKYQFSYGLNPAAIMIRPFQPEALNPEMPFLVRDYGGRWRFAIDNLGADATGRAIENYRRNKGKFFADFQLAAKAEYPEWLLCFFHKVDTPCITFVDTCNTDPGYPAQTYTMASSPCDCDQEFALTAIENKDEEFTVAANTIRVDGAAITHGALDSADLTTFVSDLQTEWASAGYDGTWAVSDASTNKIKVTFAAGEIAVGSIDIPFTLV